MEPSEVNLSFSVMAHPEREDTAQELVGQLGGSNARMVLDPDPGGPRSTVRTAREAWKPWLPGATHHLVLQDDVSLHPNFTKQAVDAIAAQPHSTVSFFAEWGSFTSSALRIAAVAGRPFVSQPDTYLSTQAAAMPVEDALRFAMYLQTVGLDVPDDHAIWRWVHENQRTHLVTNPNLVDHDTVASLVGNSFQGVRRATVFVPEESASKRWWCRAPLTELNRIPAMHWLFTEAVSYVCSNGRDERWDMQSRERLWEASGLDFSDAILRSVARLCSPEATAEGREVATGLVNILVDILVLGESHAEMHDDPEGIPFIESAIASMAPGCLRRFDSENPRELLLSSAPEILLDLSAHVSAHVRNRVGETGKLDEVRRLGSGNQSTESQP